MGSASCRCSRLTPPPTLLPPPPARPPRGQLDSIKRVWGGDRGGAGLRSATHTGSPLLPAPTPAGAPPALGNVRWDTSSPTLGPQRWPGQTDRQTDRQTELSCPAPEQRAGACLLSEGDNEVREVQGPLEVSGEVPRPRFQL